MKITHIAFFVSFLFVVLLFQCIAANKPEQKEEKGSESSAPSYPALGNIDITYLYAKAEIADMIFYNLPISVNQDDPTSAKSTVLYVSPSPVTISSACKPTGRVTWMAQGKILKEADFYADSLCYFFVFMENNKPVAANVMSESGIDFFKEVISQVQQRQK